MLHPPLALLPGQLDHVTLLVIRLGILLEKKELQGCCHGGRGCSLNEHHLHNWYHCSSMRSLGSGQFSPSLPPFCFTPLSAPMAHGLPRETHSAPMPVLTSFVPHLPMLHFPGLSLSPPMLWWFLSFIPESNLLFIMSDYQSASHSSAIRQGTSERTWGCLVTVTQTNNHAVAEKTLSPGISAMK